MLIFAVVPEEPAGTTRTQSLSTAGAYLFGPEGVAVPGSVSLGKGVVECDKPTRANAGLALQVRIRLPADAVGGEGGGTDLGLLMVSTCLLPERAEPYLLTLELARKRIMLFLNKLEDWGLVDLPADDPIMEQFERARRAFTQALVHQRSGSGPTLAGGFSAEADADAHLALALATDAGERLALRAAERAAPGRYSGATYAKAASREGHEPATPGAPVKSPDVTGLCLGFPPTIGCAVNPAVFSEPLTRAISESCDFVSVPMRWVDMEPSEGTYSFQKTDKWIEWAVRHAKLPVVAGPVVDFSKSCVPQWLSIWENDYETLRELVYEHVRHLVTRYRRAVSRWTIVSGLHVNDNFSLPFERMMDLTRVCVLVVRKLHPQARVMLEIAQPWGEYGAAPRLAMPPRLYAEMVGQAGISIDTIALRLHMGQGSVGRVTRDLMELSDLLDRYAELDRPIAVTSLGVPSRASPSGGGGLEAGEWHAPWSPEAQADWLERAATVCLAKPFVQSVCWQELADTPGQLEMPFGGLIDDRGAAKPALARLAAVRQRILAARPKEKGK